MKRGMISIPYFSMTSAGRSLELSATIFIVIFLPYLLNDQDDTQNDLDHQADNVGAVVGFIKKD